MSENKPKISISLDADLLRRIDAACEARNEARSAFIERVLENEIEGEETFVRDMESPIWRGLITALAKSPSVTMAIAKVVGEELSPEHMAQIQKRAPELAQLGRERQVAKRGKRGEGKVGVQGA